MRFFLGFLASFPLLVQSLNCNPAENSIVLWQCLQDHNKDHITLLSGHNYTISNDASLSSYRIQSLTITSTESHSPAILILKDLSEYGLFTTGTGSTIYLENIDIRGNGTGIFLHNVGNIHISNCIVSGYNISSSSTRFIS